MQATLLVELLTEELPPKSLRALSEAFLRGVSKGLADARLASAGGRAFATPRRLAVLMPGVQSEGEDRKSDVTGPSTGAPAQAIAGFAKKHGVAVEKLGRQSTPKGEVVVAHVVLKGAKLDAVLPGLVGDALKSLPIPKLMRWGAGEAQFVRPVHGLVMLHGAQIVGGEVLGLESGNKTRGHRFLGKPDIALGSADAYEKSLLDEGRVVVDFERRKADIEGQLQAQAKTQNANLGEYQGLLDEVTALVEQPSVYMGEFDKAYLAVPQECLILTMRQNQKYFPLFDAAGKLTGKFLIVSNMQVADPRNIVTGNERVVRPRLDDARFFYEQDRKQRLESRVPRLASVVYHNKLGSQLERVERIQLLSGRVARRLGADPALAERAAWLSKADLLTGMVGEFPELQGIMGRYYAQHDGEPAAVAETIEAHYRPRFAGDRLPADRVGSAVALADKLDTLAGLFGIGEQPTGEKDPFGLRRAALGVIRIIVEGRLALPIDEAVSAAFAGYGKKTGQAQGELVEFIFGRFEGYLKEQGFSALQVDAVLSKRPVEFSVVPTQLEAVKAFQALPEADSLAAANKRVANILRQAQAKGESFANAELRILKEPAERSLYEALQKASGEADRLFERGDYTGYLKTFAVLKSPVDAFFDTVKVMADEDALRRNRLGLLQDLRDAMNRVADISKLAQVKLVILDRDGTINHDSDDYIKSPDEWQPIDGSLEAIGRLTQAGYRVVVATNQSGIARGLFDTATLIAIHDKLQRAAAQAGGRVDAFFFCPHAADSERDCRKPRPGMLREIARRFNVSLADVYMVGDAQRDLEAAAAAGARPVLVLTGKGEQTRSLDKLPAGTEVFRDLAAFAQRIAP